MRYGAGSNRQLRARMPGQDQAQMEVAGIAESPRAPHHTALVACLLLHGTNWRSPSFPHSGGHGRAERWRELGAVPSGSPR